MSNKNTCLSDCINYDVANMLFAEAKESEFKPPNGGTTMKNFRISVGTKNVDGTSGELVFALDESYCFGISTNTGKKDDVAGAAAAPQADAGGETFGHSLALCLTNKKTPLPARPALSRPSSASLSIPRRISSRSGGRSASLNSRLQT